MILGTGLFQENINLCFILENDNLKNSYFPRIIWEFKVGGKISPCILTYFENTQPNYLHAL